MTRVNVIGAGPAGLTAAIVLARNGVDVTVFDRASDVGRRFHGDYQGLENWSTAEDVLARLESIGISTDFPMRPFREVTAFSPSGERHYAGGSRPLFYLIRRGEEPDTLDQALRRQAEGAGVRFVWNSNVTQWSEGTTISATGPKAPDVIATGLTFRTASPDAAYGFLDDALAPAGYAYLLLAGGRGTLATCMFRDFRNERLHFERTVARVRDLVEFDMSDPRPFGGFGNLFLHDAVEVTRPNGRLLYVGENAGFQDALWGFGLRYAIRSGHLAAVAAITGLSYRTLCEKYLLPTMRAGLSSRWAYGHFGNRGYEWVLRHVLSGNDVIPALRRLYAPDLIHRVLEPVAVASWRSRLVDKRCNHTDCECLWCRHGRHGSEIEEEIAPAMGGSMNEARRLSCVK